MVSIETQNSRMLQNYTTEQTTTLEKASSLLTSYSQMYDL